MKTRNPELDKKPALRIDRSVVIVVAMVAVGVLLISVVQMASVSAREVQQRKSRRERIAKMSQEERDQLSRKARVFLEEFDENKRRTYRDLHRELEGSENAEALKTTLSRYNQWLATLSPYERDELRDQLSKATSPDDRRKKIKEAKDLQEHKKWLRTLSSHDRWKLRDLKVGTEKYNQIVGEIRAKQEERLARGESRLPLMRSRSGRYGQRPRPKPQLSSSDLDSALNVVFVRLRLSGSQNQEFQSLSPLRRRVRILHEAVRLHDTPKGKPSRGFLSDTTLKLLVANSTLDSNLKERLIKFDKAADYPWELLSILLRATSRELFSRSKKPTDEELSGFLESMKASDRAELIRFRGDELQRWLEFKYDRKRRSTVYKANRELFTSVGKLPDWSWARFSQQRSSKRKGTPNRNGRRKGRGDGSGDPRGNRKPQRSRG